MKRDKYGRFIGKSEERPYPPRRDAKGRFLKKPELRKIDKPKPPESLVVRFGDGTEIIGICKKLDNVIKTNRIKTYSIEDIRNAYIAGLNDTQGLLPLSKRFEIYCKRNNVI